MPDIVFKIGPVTLFWVVMVLWQIFMLKSDLFDADHPNMKVVADLLNKTPAEREAYNRNRKNRAIFTISITTLFCAFVLILILAP